MPYTLRRPSVSPDTRPIDDPDLNLLDYCIFGVKQDRVFIRLPSPNQGGLNASKAYNHVVNDSVAMLRHTQHNKQLFSKSIGFLRKETIQGRI